nr:hypothetical protein [Tanacetum cinerariifolium]
MGKGIIGSNGRRCGGKGRRGGSIAGSGGDWLVKCLIVSNDGRDGGRLVVRGEEKIVWMVEMVPMVEKSMVEGLSLECSRVCVGGESGRGLTKQHAWTLILAVHLNSFADFLSLFNFGIVRLVKFMKGVGEGMFGTRGEYGPPLGCMEVGFCNLDNDARALMAKGWLDVVLGVDMKILSGNMFVFVSRYVPTLGEACSCIMSTELPLSMWIMLTTYEAIAVVMTTRPAKGIKEYHEMVCDGVCCQYSSVLVMLSGCADSIMQMWLIGSSRALNYLLSCFWPALGVRDSFGHEDVCWHFGLGIEELVSCCDVFNVAVVTMSPGSFFSIMPVGLLITKVWDLHGFIAEMLSEVFKGFVGAFP